MTRDMYDFSDRAVAQYEAVRRSGDCNMMDKACVRRAARSRGFAALVRVINDGRYGELLGAYDRDTASSVHDDFDFTGGGL